MVRERERLLDQRTNVDETIVLVSAEDLERDSLVKIAKLYADVFAPPPWNEAFKCDRCGKFAGLETIKGSSCECGGKHTEAYPLEETVDYISKEAQKEGFRMAIVRDDEEDIVGFSWSYLTTIDEVAEGKWSEANDIEKVGAQVEDMEKVMNSVEARMRDLTREKQIIPDAENRINGLSLLMEDIKAQIKNLAAEEQEILNAIEKTSELRFLLGEVESKLNILRQEKERLAD